MSDTKTKTEEKEASQHETGVNSKISFDKKFYNQVQGPDGQFYFVEKTIDIDKLLSSSHRESKWQYSQYIADQICEEIATGAALTTICKADHMPPYSVVSHWRREQKDFNEALESAYLDRAETFRDQLQELLYMVENKNVKSAKLKSEILKTLAGYDRPRKYGKLSVKENKVEATQINIVLPVNYDEVEDISDIVDLDEITNYSKSQK